MINLDKGQILTNRFSGKSRKIIDTEVSGGITIRIQLENKQWLETHNLTNFILADPEGKEIKEYGRNKPNAESGSNGSGNTGRNDRNTGTTRTAKTTGRSYNRKSK